MSKRISLVISLLYLLLIFVIYKAWLFPGVITGGDMWYFFPSMFDNHKFFPSEWAFFAGNGLGGSAIPYMAINFFMSIPLFFGKTFGISWDLLVRFFILYPFLISVSLSSYLFFRKLFPESNFAILSVLIFSLNTYILMLVSGGLVVIGIAYSLIPLIFLLIVKIVEGDKFNLRLVLFLGLISGVQSILDVRVTYITFVGVILYIIANTIFIRGHDFLKQFSIAILLPAIIAVLLNSFWVVPSLFFGSNALNELGNNYTTVESVKFFSFAKFENAISLLHPNWPENVFGKTYFQRPEFLVFPILAFSSLLFITKKNIRIILPFILIAIVSTFLAKGSNDPFGSVYIFLFENVPGFVFYRDPTKWYMLIAFTFSVLIPFTLHELYKRHNKLGNLTLVLFALFFFIAIFPALSGRIPGTFQTSTVPDEYIQFERFMVGQDPARVLWIPSPSRFSYFSENHPAVSANRYFSTSTPSAAASLLDKERINELIGKQVGYVGVPYDNRSEIFLKDREYDRDEYEATVKELMGNPNLTEIEGFGNLKIFRVKNAVDKPLEYNGTNVNLRKIVNMSFFISASSFIFLVTLLVFLKTKK